MYALPYLYFFSSYLYNNYMNLSLVSIFSMMNSATSFKTTVSLLFRHGTLLEAPNEWVNTKHNIMFHMISVSLPRVGLLGIPYNTPILE